MNGFNITEEDKKVGKVITIYGKGGSGKTTIIAQAIKKLGGLFVSCIEDGLSPLQQSKVFCDLSGISRIEKPIQKWTSAKEEYKLKVLLDSKEITKKEYDERFSKIDRGFKELLNELAIADIKAVGFDSISMLKKPLEGYCFQKYYVEDPKAHGEDKTVAQLRKKAYGYGKTELIAFMDSEFDTFIRFVNHMRGRGIDVYISSHTAIKKGRIIGDELEYDFASIDLPSTKHVSLDTSLFNVSDACLYGTRDMDVAKRQKIGVAIGTYERILITDGTPTERAKNRFGMPHQIPATFEELEKYF